MRSPVLMNARELDAALTVLARYGCRLDGGGGGGGLVVLEGAQLQFSCFNEHGDLVTILGDVGVACRALFELATAAEMILLPEGATPA